MPTEIIITATEIPIPVASNNVCSVFSIIAQVLSTLRTVESKVIVIILLQKAYTLLKALEIVYERGKVVYKTMCHDLQFVEGSTRSLSTNAYKAHRVSIPCLHDST